jgi:hypothetical protein
MGLLKEKCGSPYEALQFYKKSLFPATEFCISKSRLNYRIGVVKCQHYKYPLVSDFYKSIRSNKFNIYSYISLKRYLRIRGTELIIDEELDNSEMAALLNTSSTINFLFNQVELFRFNSL